jgi:hypothetical protein
VLRVLGHLNYRFRLTKFGWDPKDGEIVAYADVWVEDGDLTQRQFGALFKSLIPAIDLAYKRLSTVMETGSDPGDGMPAGAGSGKPAGESGGGLPTELEILLGKLAEKDKRKQEEEEGGGFGKV